MAGHTLKFGQKARQYDSTDFQDGSVKRIIKKLSDIERAALPSAQLEEVWSNCFFFKDWAALGGRNSLIGWGWIGSINKVDTIGMQKKYYSNDNLYKDISIFRKDTNLLENSKIAY